MKSFRRISLVLAIMMMAIVSNAQEIKNVSHTVKQGQTLFSIAKLYNSTVDDILNANPGCTTILSIGQVLCVPSGSAAYAEAAQSTSQSVVVNAAQPKAATRKHTIKWGETLYRLSVNYNVSVEAICAANPGLSPDNFHAGDVITIPASDANGAKEADTAQKEANDGEKTKAVEKANDKAKAAMEKIELPEGIIALHNVMYDETVGSICEMYNITSDDLIKANPILQEKLLMEGMVLNIPVPTLNLQEEPAASDTIKKAVEGGDEIAGDNAEIEEEFETELSAEDSKSMNPQKRYKKMARLSEDKVLNVAVILSFMLDSYAPKEQARLVEYYEGFLMAVEELKREGYSFIINTYDAGPKDKSLDSLFDSGALDYTELIIGATYSSHTKELAQFAKKNEIPLVIPFSSKTEEAIDNPMVFVASSVNSYVVPKVCTKFVEEFSTANIVFVDDAKNGNKTEFINALKAELDKNSILHRTIDMKQVTSTVNELQANKKNVVVVPTSASATTLNTILPSLIDAKATGKSKSAEGKIILFGYPEWQIHAKNTRNMMYEIDTYFYATFYSNEVFPSVNHFQKSFVNWYNHGIQNIYPRYGMLGYDTGRFFLLAASKYGKEIGLRINETPAKPIQSDFLFERIGENGGYINTKYFFVHYTPKYTVDRIDYDKAENSNTTGGFDVTNNTEENQEFDFNSGVSEDINTATDTE